MSITNPKLKDYDFLKEMKEDSYFPNFLVEKGVIILKELCIQIESTSPNTDEEIYKLTHSATEKFNGLQEEFEDNESEIETAAREAIAEDFDVIVKAYGFDLDIEEVIAPRDW